VDVKGNLLIYLLIRQDSEEQYRKISLPAKHLHAKLEHQKSPETVKRATPTAIDIEHVHTQHIILKATADQLMSVP